LEADVGQYLASAEANADTVELDDAVCHRC
jgi:hypothetical protein